ncbi:MAG: molybdopterin cofactor-binding domain-containing protein [Burkholderiales bacterium]
MSTNIEAHDDTLPESPGRRDFLKSSGVLVVGFALAPELALAQQPPTPPALPGSLQSNRMLSAWLRINSNGTVTVFTGKIELGQGIATALAQIAADELDIDYQRIEVISGDTSRTPNEGVTAGSLSVEQSGTAIRFAAAEARQLLLGAAAAKLGVAADALKVADGAITEAGGKRTTYWDVTAEANLQREATAMVKPKNPSEYKWVGQSLIRRDIPPKFTGTPSYVQDLRLPGMLHARVVRPPAPRAELVSIDEAGVKKLQGVVAVVRDGSFLGVIAEREEQAIKAREVLQASAVWMRPDLGKTIQDAFGEATPSITAPEQLVAGAQKSADVKAVRTLEATYNKPFQLHASMGPSCAVAKWEGEKVTVWTHSQGVFPLRGDMSRALKTPPSNITCIHMEGAGCYGHNGADDVAYDAVLLAKAASGRPVRVQWMRDDEFMWEPFGSAMIMKMKAGLDDAGNIVSWGHELWSYPHSTRPGSGPEGANLLAAWHQASPTAPTFPNDIPQPAGGSDRNAVPLYDFPSQRISKHYVTDAPLRTSALRTLGGYANVFAAEAFIDEAAVAAGADPVEYRLRHMKNPRARAVIEATARLAKWTPNTRGSANGDILSGRGIAFSMYKNLACYNAVIADVEVNRKTGEVRVVRAYSAVDAGLSVNPDGVANQIEGGIIQSASWTLNESLKFDRTGVKTKSWADYPILRFTQVPAVEVEIIQRPNERSLGVGEGSQGPAAAAIANAFANATGKRIRDIPFTPDRVKALLA